MPSPFISVIIPTYNSADFIREAINSVLEQTFKDYEIVCVDNNSTDNTVAMLQEINLKNGGRIKILKEQQQGSNFARNKGLNNANGEWIQFLDSDDILYKNKLQAQFDLIAKTNCDLVVGNYYYDIDNKRVPYVASADHWSSLIKSELGCTPSNLWKKNLLQDLGGWDNVKSSQENFLLFKFLKANAKIVIDTSFNCLVRKINPVSISSSNLGENFKRSIDLRIDMYQYLEKQGLLTKGRKDTANSFILDLLIAYYRYKKKESLKYYDSFYKKNFVPIKEKLNTGYYYLLILFGFNIANLVSSLLKKKNK